MGKSVHVLAPDLRPLEKHDFEGYVRDVVAVPDGFLVVEKSDVRGICGASFPPGLTAQVSKYPFGTRLLPDGTVLVWEGTDFARVDVKSSSVLARFKTESGMSSTRHVAVAPDGTIWSGMAMSWSSPGEPTEYYATIAAFAPDGGKRQEWGYDDGIPTSTGFDLQVMAVDGFGIVCEHGTAILSPGARRPARFETLSNIALRPDGMLFGTNGSEICRTPLDGNGLETIGRVREGEYVRRVVADGAGRLYLGTTTGILAVSENGAEMFRVEPFDTGALLLGEGFLIAVGSQTGTGLIRVH